jgi:hypothetical protein
MNINPPPVPVEEFNWIWVKWFSTLYDFLTMSEYRNFSTTAAATTIDSETVLLVDTTSGAITITLPPSADNEGRCYYIKDSSGSANAVTVDGNASETIDGSLTLVLTAGSGFAKLFCDGANWHIIGN